MQLKSDGLKYSSLHQGYLWVTVDSNPRLCEKVGDLNNRNLSKSIGLSSVSCVDVRKPNTDSHIALHRPAIALHRLAITLHRGAIVLHRLAITLHRGAIVLHRLAITLHRGAIVLHRPAITLHRDAIALHQPVKSFPLNFYAPTKKSKFKRKKIFDF
jgi:hypothetical protein